MVLGRVQGVSYRSYAQEQATKLNLGGYIRNLPDGSAEIFVQGTEDKIKQFIEWAKKGSPHSKVEQVKVVWQEFKKDAPEADQENFNIY